MCEVMEQQQFPAGEFDYNRQNMRIYDKYRTKVSLNHRDRVTGNFPVSLQRSHFPVVWSSAGSRLNVVRGSHMATFPGST